MFNIYRMLIFNLLGISPLCIFSSILNFKSSNQGIELQAKGSF